MTKITGFNLYYKKQRIEVKKENPDMSTKDIKMIIISKWKECTEDIKSDYDTKALKMLENPIIKKPLSSYMYFNKDVYSKVKNELQDPSFKNISKEVGRKWKLLTSDEKQVYISQAKDDMERYKRENTV